MDAGFDDVIESPSIERCRELLGEEADDLTDREVDVIESPSIVRCRELLGEEADDLTDREVDDIRRHVDAPAHVIVRTFLEQRMLDE